MTPIFPELPHTLGVYTLVRLLETRPDGDLYEATQSHVERAVVVEVIRPGATRAEEARFLESARMRVAADVFPNVGQVYESLKADGLWFLTQELPKGVSLAQIAERGERLSVRAVCRIIEETARIYGLCQQAGLSTRSLSAAGIFLDETETPRFLSPVTAAQEETPVDAADMAALADAMQPIRPKDVPGENRVLTLLQWLREGYEGQQLDWNTHAASAHTVLEQLGQDKDTANNEAPSDATLKRRGRKARRKIAQTAGYAAGLAALFAGCASLGMLFPQQREEQLPPVHSGLIFCNDRGNNVTLSDHCVSRAEYGRFLDAWDTMNAEERKRLNIVETADHIPLGWDNTRDAAPVSGVCYADAVAYARFAGAELPTAEQVQAALTALPAADNLWEWTRGGRSALPAALCPSTAILMPHAANTAPRSAGQASQRDTAFTFRLLLPSTHNASL